LYAKAVEEISRKLNASRAKVAELQGQVQNLTAHLERQKNDTQKRSSLTGVGDIDLDVYSQGVTDATLSRVTAAMKLKGFQPDYPVLPKTMTMSRTTTVYYYDSSYIPAAAVLAQDLANILNHKVVTKKGASSFAKNKIIVHMSGQ